MNYRDDFEEAARETLKEHFEVLSVTFSVKTDRWGMLELAGDEHPMPTYCFVPSARGGHVAQSADGSGSWIPRDTSCSPWPPLTFPCNRGERSTATTLQRPDLDPDHR